MASEMIDTFSETEHSLECMWVSLEKLLELESEWNSLAASAAEPTPFYEKNFLTASAIHLPSGKDFQLLLVKDTNNGNIVGLFPFDLVPLFGKAGKPYLRMHYSPFIEKTVPLIAGVEPTRVWKAAFAAIGQRDDIFQVVELVKLTTNRPVSAALLQIVEEQNLACVKLGEFERPLLEWDGGSQEYNARRSKNRRKSVRQRQKKLERQGDVSISTAISGGSDYPEMFTVFLNLEASGWKGKRRSALSSNKKLLDYARAAFCSHDDNPQIQIDVLKLDNVPIAANMSLIGGRALYALKSAYDEAYAKFGPGLLLDYLTTNTWLDERRFAYVDSCTQPDSPLASLWLEREKVQHILVPADASVNHLVLETLKRRHSGKETLRSVAKKLLFR